ncbi:MAG: hypothetical protein AAGH46_09815 [Bacteroidota bacterium]
MPELHYVLEVLKSNLDKIGMIGLIGLVAAIFSISEKVQAFIFLVFSKLRKDPHVITGKWLLFIYNKDDIWKIDEYSIKQFGHDISGNIKRLYSGEDKSQESRTYDFKGYFYKDEIYYAFKPKSLKDSYGICIMESGEKDLEYQGFYYRPFHKRKNRRSRYTVKLTKHISEVENIIALSTIHKRIRNNKVNAKQ